ncbi:MAG TPA: hypothetical protein VJ836_05145 [Candidatus Saccharimonadales bacterium]|nr:hypothetical protein [Candidatus Saccharimonadales bacterium]
METLYHPEMAANIERVVQSRLKSGPEEIGKMVLNTAQTGVPEAGDGKPTPFGLEFMLGVRLDPDAPPPSLAGTTLPTVTPTNQDGKSDEMWDTKND